MLHFFLFTSFGVEKMLFFYRVYIFLILTATLGIEANERKIVLESTFDISKNHIVDVVDQYIEFLGDKQNVEDTKKNLKLLGQASISYYQGLDRLFFFKYSYSRNSNRIKYYYKSYLEMSQTENFNHVLHYQLQKAYKSWETLHSNYAYYSGYFF